MAAEDSTTSPALKVHSVLSVAGGVAAETPVRVGVPRNCRQASAGDAAGAVVGAVAGCCADVAVPQTTAPSAPFSSFSAERRVIVDPSRSEARLKPDPATYLTAS